MLKINRFGRRSATVLAISALTVAVGGSAAQAKTIKNYKTVCVGHLTGSASTAGKCTGSLGKGTFKAAIAPPTSTTTAKYKGGTITIVLKIVLKNNKVTGTWKIKKGTGKFKKAKGKGTSVAVLDPKTNQTTATSKGKLTY